MTAFEMSDRLPRQKRVVQTVTADLAHLYEPALVPGELYELESIVVPVERIPGYPPVAVRMTGFPESVPLHQVQAWVDALKRLALSAAEKLR